MTAGEKSRIQILRDHVKAAEQSSNRATADIPFRNATITLTKIRVKSDFPLYRIESGRTHRAQAAYLDAHTDFPRNFFEDAEDGRVQRAQHEILVRMIQEEELDKDLEEKKQKSPIVLTYDGYIVDGNRRVAALREANEEYILAVVLPEDAQKSELYETELELQMARDTKAGYNWIDELLHIRYGIQELNETMEQIAKRMRREKNEIQESLEKLTYVDRYLSWIDAPGQYHKIPDDDRGSMRQAFTDIADRMNGRPVKRLTRQARDTIVAACFSAIKRGEGYKAIRSIIKHMSTKPDTILGKLKDEKEISVGDSGQAVGKATRSENDKKDPLDELAEDELKDTPQSFQVFDQLLKKPNDAEKVAGSLVKIVGEMEDEEKESKRNPLQLVEKAVVLLEKIDLTPDAPEITKLAKALASLDEHINRLTKQIQEIQNKSN
jgi:hypothetical protein